MEPAARRVFPYALLNWFQTGHRCQEDIWCLIFFQFPDCVSAMVNALWETSRENNVHRLNYLAAVRLT